MRMICRALVLVAIVVAYGTSAPVKPKPAEEEDQKSPFEDLAYKHYLQEVINELEKDPEFKKRVEAANSANQSNIAQHLDFVHHSVRSRLDEVKRREVERLNLLEEELERAREISQRRERGQMPIPQRESRIDDIIRMNKAHLDHTNPHTFEVSDLEKLIQQATADLSKVDKQEEDEFKRYEMEKRHDREEKLNKINDEKQRHEEEKKLKDAEARHKDHPKVHHPGSEEQLKEVWNEDDHMDPGSFNPVTFFKMHDTNSDGHWDVSEVEALMQNELAKVYDPNNKDDDMQERYHEEVRMRQETMREMDANKDGLISQQEFVDFTKSRDYKEDNGWKVTEEEMDRPPYTDDEYNKFMEDYKRMHPEEFQPPESTPPHSVDAGQQQHKQAEEQKQQGHQEQQHKQAEEQKQQGHQEQQQHKQAEEQKQQGHQQPAAVPHQQQQAMPPKQQQL